MDRGSPQKVTPGFIHIALGKPAGPTDTLSEWLLNSKKINPLCPPFSSGRCWVVSQGLLAVHTISSSSKATAATMALPTWKLSLLFPFTTVCKCLPFLTININIFTASTTSISYLLPDLPPVFLSSCVSAPLLFHDLHFSIAQLSSATFNLYNYSL